MHCARSTEGQRGQPKAPNLTNNLKPLGIGLIMKTTKAPQEFPSMALAGPASRRLQRISWMDCFGHLAVHRSKATCRRRYDLKKHRTGAQASNPAA